MAGGVTGGSKYARWLVADVAAEACEVNDKTIRREAAAGLIQSQRWRRDRHTPYRTVYHPGDVARRARERRAAALTAHVLPDGAEGPDPAPDASDGLADGPAADPGTALATRSTTAAASPGLALVRELIALVGTVRDATPPAPARVVDVEGAARAIYWTPRQIRAAVRDGRLPANFSDQRNWRTWRIWLADLERLRPLAPAVVYRREVG